MQKLTTGVSVPSRVLSETILLLLGLWLLWLWDLGNLWIRIYYTGLGGMWVIVLSWRRRLGYHGRLLSRRVRRGYSTAGIWTKTRGSEVWMLKCFGCCDPLCRIKLKEALKQIDCYPARNVSTDLRVTSRNRTLRRRFWKNLLEWYLRIPGPLLYLDFRLRMRVSRLG